MKELKKKEKKVRSFMKKNDFDGIILSKADNFAWMTCGGSNFVNKFTEYGEVDLFITEKEKYCVTSEIEKYRIVDEEIKNQGYEIVDYDWFESKEDIIKSLIKGKRIGSDTGCCNTVNIYKKIKNIRASLTIEEIKRLKDLANLCTNAMEKVCKNIKIGDKEYEIVADLANELMLNEVETPVILIAADDRIFKYRHPLPTDKKVEKYVMVILSARKYGLVVSLTRLVHFGQLDNNLKKKYNACAKIDALAINETKVGKKISDIFSQIIKAYEYAGYKDEWKLHHQGGPAGYLARDYLATPYKNDKVQNNQIFAWNPSITGTKVEDSILVNNNGYEILTEIENWPVLEINIGGEKIKRPDILIK